MGESISTFVPALTTMVELTGHVEMIAVMELLGFVSVASQENCGWDSRLLFYVIDNQNVDLWLKKRRPRGHTARRLVLLLHRVEIENKFTCFPVYIRTYRNQLADWLSREDLARVRQELVVKGCEEPGLLATGIVCSKTPGVASLFCLQERMFWNRSTACHQAHATCTPPAGSSDSR